MNKFPLFIFCAFLSVNCLAQTTIEEKLDAQLHYLNQEALPGCAIGIIQNGKTLLSKGYGLANLEHQIAFGPETVSDIGSVAKQITCFGIVLLAQEGKLALNDPIQKYFPDAPAITKNITIQHLIYHTSGLREIYGTQGIAGMRPGDAIYQEDAVQLLKISTSLNFEPGSSYSYCNTAYMLLAEIISKVGEQPFEDWMRTNIFLPLGMEHTYIMDKPGEVFPKAAASYRLAKDSTFMHLFDNSTVQGAGGIYTTIPDVLRWIDNYRTKKLGGQTAYDQMVVEGLSTSGFPLSYAFGLRLETPYGFPAISHTGSSAAYRTQMIYIPEKELGFIMKTNQATIDRTAVSDIVLEHFLSADEKTDFLNEDITIEPPRSESYTSNDFSEFVGSYFCPELETVYSFFVQDDQLMVKHFRLGKATLKPKKKDQFSIEEWYLTKLNFKRNKENKITGMYLDGGGVRNLWFEKIDSF